ncbi:YkvA family protein [Lysobacter sp. D1-1-M9]|uniref:YkvA family protein n=1 Tax=Novilysobacter longmucuonensis TaxID=3098603 RepID=UPI002FC86674
MNALLANDYPLPSILESSMPGPHRRRRIDTFCPGESGIVLFNGLLSQLGGAQAVDCDQLATAGRKLRGRTTLEVAASIHQRMRRAAATARMVRDAGWAAANDAADAARLMLDYVRRPDDLIPDRLPGIGRLDDAIVVDLAWPRLSTEVQSYMDFRRLRRIEAALRNCSALATFGFTRADWQEARLAEAALSAHQRQVREHSYLPAAAALFRVH